jgi:hypothetical protein
MAMKSGKGFEAKAAQPYRREGDATLIEVNLRRIAQLFNSLDPSPFHERDLDVEAESYLVGAVREIGLTAPVKLVIHLPEDELSRADPGEIERAIHNYFRYRAGSSRREMRERFRHGRISLAVGLSFLLACIALREFVLSLDDNTLTRAIAEGLVILGWVAMWGPLHIFLYDWLPVARMRRTLARLAELPVELRAASS